MDALVVDSSSQPRTYRVRDKVTASPGAVPVFICVGLIFAAVGVWIIWQGVTISGIGPAMAVTWTSWIFSQIQLGCMGALGMVFVLGGLGIGLLIVISQLRPTWTTWRLDGSGLYGTAGVGGVRLGTADYYPFSSIHLIAQTEGRVELYLRHVSTDPSQKTLASGLTTQDAARLVAYLQEDLAAARAQWLEQGLQLDPHLAGHPPLATAHPAPAAPAQPGPQA